MKMRQHKHFVQHKVWIGISEAYWQRRIDEMLTLTPAEKAASDARHQAMIDQLFKDIGLGGLASTPIDPMVTDFMAGPSVHSVLAAKRMELSSLVEDLPNLAPEFRCVKVNGGEIVDTFQTRSEALALVLKHARQRKAKLQVINTDTGEVFSEAEMA